MSQVEMLKSISRDAAGDLSTTGIMRFVEVDTSGRVAVCNAAGEDALGVLQNKPSAAGQAAEVAVWGVAKIILGGTVAAKDKVATDNQGRAVTAASTNHVLGTCLKGGAVGEIGEVLLGARHILA